MTHSVTELPFCQLLGLRQAEEPALLTLPEGGQYLNHLGTVHAGALLALAESASGEFLLKHLGYAQGVIPVVRRMEAKFRKPANGAVTASVSTALEHIAGLKDELSSKGRALTSITVELHDQSGTHVFSATMDWFITKAA